MKTRISVIIPIYNVQEFLEECIDSVLNQTINQMPLTDGYKRNLQIILVDDGSTDDSAAISKKYEEKYENVEYRYEENQGLGHARNYGCEFAEGDYIIFLDSDDVVPADAYQFMYNAAVTNDSDMTIGAVQRFNSKGCWSSNIHNIAFSGTDLVSHISKNPNLFYDTTSWNKLIRRSFWVAKRFQFPEGILYEDIPVTIPMHFLANNVSIVREVCYLWRVREGISKSITQTTNDLKNLNDRLFVMRLVDEFFKKNVTDPNLHDVKNLKWLQIDLMIFVNKLKSMTQESSQELVEVLSKYIRENIPASVFDDLNELQRLKYETLLAGDFDNLIHIMNFEYENLKNAALITRDNKIAIACDKDIFGTPALTIDKLIKSASPTRYIQGVVFEKKHLTVTGFALIPGLKLDNVNLRRYSFYLINSTSRKTIPLEHSNAAINNLNEFNIRYGSSCSYDAAGYNVYIPYDILKDNPDFIGQNRIMVTFEQEGIKHSFYAGKAKQNVRAASTNKAKMRGNNYFSISYDYSNELIINVAPVKYRFDNIYITGDKLCLACENHLGDMHMHYDGDSINQEKNIPFKYNSDTKEYTLKLSSLRSTQGRIMYDDGTPAVYKWKKFMCVESKYKQCLINTLRDYYINIKTKDYISLISEINGQKSSVFFKTALLCPDSHNRLPDSAVLYFKNTLSEKVEPVSTSLCFYAGGHITADFDISLKDKKITRNLYQDAHDLFIDYDFGDHTITTEVYINDLFEFLYQSKLYDYKLYRSRFGTLRLQSTKKWAKRENNNTKRLALAGSTYTRLRCLPIKKNRIIFESMWGSKYSCNPRYLYEYIDEHHPEFECIWSLSDEHIPINGNGKRVRRLSFKYFYYLATSKYFVNNVNFHPHYVKRPGQIEIQTMHGTPLKTLGLDVPGDFHTKKQEDDYIERCNRWDYLTVQSQFVADISKQCFLFKKEFLKYGYPRTDILYTKDNKEDIVALKKKIGIPLDKKVILYAPTWRVKNSFDLMLDLDSFKASLSDEYILILKLHHFSVAGWTQPEHDSFVYDLSLYDSIEELYLVSDLLITDYSSVMFDYSILNRPIFLFAYDMEEYRDKLRGFYIDIESDKPGPIVYTSKELLRAIENFDETEKEFKPYREKFRQKFISYECENSSERIFNEVIKK